MTVMASLLALFLLSSSPVISAEVSFFQESLTVSMETEDTIYVPVSISIPENGYIYSNPKGPGTGKPVSFSVNGDKILTDTVFVTEPVRHTSPLSDDWVWIHKDGLTLYIPITAGAEAAGEYTIAFDALFCDDASCTPVGDTLNLSITTGENSGILRTELPDSVLQIDLIQHDTDLQQDEEASAGTPVFTPHYIGTHTVSALFPAIIAAFVAGILLNVMPCVLPVISIKIMSLVRLHSHKRGELLLHGVTYAAGVITSFLFLASLAAFAGANWGSLFQNRIFIVAMSVIIFSLSLSLLGVYTLQTPAWISSISSSSSVVTSSFLSGLIATLLATPCSGPFLGATLAWTLTQPPGVIYAVFISIGAGLSFPFILLSLFPSLLSSLP
ncbi:MAG: cytochrome c biogenesis protein CcdA, partial [Spirochaetota bacterium]